LSAVTHKGLRPNQGIVKRAFKVIVALLLLWLVVRNLNLEALVAALQRLRFWPVTGAIAIFFLSCCVATSKWRLLWPKAPWLEMLKANFIGQFYSTALPGQIAGEVVKTYRLGQRFSDTAAVAASVLVDRATGIVGLLLLAFVGVLLSKTSVPGAAVAVLVGSAAAVMAALCAISVPRLADTAKSVIERLGDRWRLLRGLGGALTALLLAWKTLMSRPRFIVGSICLGIAFQALGIFAHLIVASTLGIEIGFFEWSWIFGLVSLLLLLPVTIAGIGVREGSYAGLLGMVGVSIEKAVALSLVMFGISLLGVAVGGLLELAHSVQSRSHPHR